MSYPDSALLRRPHSPGCTGALYRLDSLITTDRVGRIGNGGLVAHEYRCNRRWDGCAAWVLVSEMQVRRMALAVEVRP